MKSITKLLSDVKILITLLDWLRVITHQLKKISHIFEISSDLYSTMILVISSQILYSKLFVIKSHLSIHCSICYVMLMILYIKKYEFFVIKKRTNADINSTVTPNVNHVWLRRINK